MGIAVGSGTDIAIEAADYVLMRDDLEDVLTAIDLSKKTFGRIKLNYIWAMGYNIVMIPVAAGVLYPVTRMQVPPWVAGHYSSSCLALSDFLVFSPLDMHSHHVQHYTTVSCLPYIWSLMHPFCCASTCPCTSLLSFNTSLLGSSRSECSPCGLCFPWRVRKTNHGS